MSKASTLTTRSFISQAWRRHLTRETQFFLDLCVLVGSFCFAYLLRFDFRVPASEVHAAAVQLPLVVLLQFIGLYAVGIYSFVWRYVGLSELASFFKAGLLSATPLLLLRLGLPDHLQSWRVPISIIVVSTATSFGTALLMRVARRMIFEAFEGGTSAGKKKLRTLLVGAGRSGRSIASQAKSHPGAELDILGFLDRDPQKRGSIIQGIRVVGEPTHLTELIDQMQVELLIISMDSMSRRELRRIIDTCERKEVRIKIIPGIWEMIGDDISVNRLREIKVDDLLGRDPVELDEDDLRRLLTDRTILVTGAGGSIGAEIVRQICRLEPARLIVVERSEPALFRIERELASKVPHLERIAVVADIGDPVAMRRLFTQCLPDVIFHAAAHKHVPMLEANAAEAIKNNVLGTRNLGQVAGRMGVETFVLISTDKAVRPTSVMGASKRLAELAIQDLNQRFETRFMAVRFGNVLGSDGSAIQIFQDQIRNGGPVTVTHEDMVRYFMTIPEAAQLVMQAGALGEGGEIFMLDMGEPVKIIDLAKDIIRLSGLKPYEDIDIFITGIRPGEKLFEELEVHGEEFGPTKHRKIFSSRMAKPLATDEFNEVIERLKRVLGASDEHIKLTLAEVLPETHLRGVSLRPDDAPKPQTNQRPQLVH